MRIVYNDEKIEIGRVFAGFAWPGEQPGFAVAVGETKFPEVGYRGKYHYYLMREVEETDKERLIKACLHWQKEFPIDVYYGGPQNNDNYRYLWQWNHNLRPEGLPAFDVYPATYEESISYLIDVLKSAMSRENPRLHGLEGSKVMNYLLEIRSETQTKLTEGENPAAAALAYAVASLVESPPREENPGLRRKKRPTTVTGY
jgi:hypothetical protein